MTIVSSSNGKSSSQDSVPKHVAIIMDGNGRWAVKNGLPRVDGHKSGVKRVRPIVEECIKQGIQYLTLYCFSTENWKRPELEISTLMKLFTFYIDAEINSLKENGVRLRAIGDRSKLPKGVVKALESAEKKTENETRLHLILALSYGAREEIVSATRQVLEDVTSGNLSINELTEENFGNFLYTCDIPDPDLLIRTSGEYRISNFLLWQLAYSEIVFTSVLWPDFSVDEFLRCIHEYQGRTRRFGLTDEQILKEGRQ